MTESHPFSARLILGDGEVFELADACQIGRASANQIVLDDTSVSRNHATVHRIGSDFWLADLGSSNGTTLNGRFVAQPTKLADGDRIGIGRHEIGFSRPEADEAQQTLAASTLVSIRVVDHWLVVADIEGFTPLSRRLGSRELSLVVGEWFRETRFAAESAGCSIYKYLGDGWLGGWPSDTNTPEKVASCLAALETSKVGGILPFRLALHFGKATSSASPLTGVLDLIGPDVNYVFRMEKIAAAIKEPRIVSSAAAHRLEGHAAFRPLGAHAVPGFESEDDFFAPARPA